jgi:RNA polymerase sigma-70 factor (ECF subfamily)
VRDDRELVRAHLRGDRTAFAALVERHQRRVYNVAYGMLGRPEDAADAAQDVFLACLRKLAGYRGDAAFTTWLHRVTVNTCHDALRKRAREQPAREGDPDPPEEMAPDPADAAVASADVRRALAAVPEEFRAAVVLHDLRGLPYEEVAEILGAPVGTVKSRIHRGRVAMARALHGEPAGPPRPSNARETT